jgi:hypothetical protein
MGNDSAGTEISRAEVERMIAERMRRFGESGEEPATAPYDASVLLVHR